MGELILRPARFADASILYVWRNDMASIKASLSGEAVEWNRHQKWLSDLLIEGENRIFIAELRGVAIAMVRFDMIDDGGYEASWIIAPEMRGKRLGRVVLEAAVELYPKVKLIARIRVDNLPSRKIALQNGFRLSSERDGICVFTRHRC